MKTQYLYLLLISILLINGCINNTENTSTPNFLFLIYDDASWEHFGCYGDQVVRTPGTDMLAESGMLFTNAYCAAPSCSPSRAGILSGQDIYRLEEASVLGGFIQKKFILLPELLEEKGYSCGYIGKPYWPATYVDENANAMPTGPSYNIIRERNVREGLTVWGKYDDNFRIFLNQVEKDQPFFFWVGIQEPHVPWPPGFGLEQGIDTSRIRVPEFLPDVSETKMDLSDYYGEIMFAEEQIVKMIETLEEKGLLDNTVIVSTSDNGMPMPRAKATLYDHGVRMPLVIRWGDKSKQARFIDNPVSLIDIAPTFLDLAGIDIPPEMTGRSLKNIILASESGTIENERDFVVSAIERHVLCRENREGYPRRALHTEDYTYIRNFEPDRWPVGDPDIVDKNGTPRYGDCDGSRTKQFLIEKGQLSEYSDLFNLWAGKVPEEQLLTKNKDPDMVDNLASDPNYYSVLEELRKKLTDYLKATDDPRLTGN